MGEFPAYFLKTKGIPNLLNALAERYHLYVPGKVNEVIHYRLYDPESDSLDESQNGQGIIFGESHATAPLKTFFFPAREKVGTYFSEKGEEEGPEEKPLAILGVKSYDLRSLELLDLIFGEGDFLDPTYVERRESSLIIASDCTSVTDECFSPLVGVELFPEDHFDLAVAEVKGGLVVSVGSEKGKGIVEENAELFTEVDPGQISERDANRKELREKAEEQVREYRINVPYEELLRKEIDSPVWLETTKTCVECGACVLVCPTCYCFLLADQVTGEAFDRIRTWDTCQYGGFARVAGGGNPRLKLAERLRHRYLHKFDYLKESYDFYACTGCGRCIQACMGKIDMRKVFVELAGAAVESK